MFRFLLAAIAAISLVQPTVALADRGKPGEVVWVQATSSEQAVGRIVAIIERGGEARFGSKRSYTSYAFNPMSREVRFSEVVRPIGVSKNIAVTTIVQLDTGMAVQRNEAGVILARFQVGHEQMNGKAMLSQALANMLPAITNGLGAAVVQAAFPPCGDGGCGGGAVAYSISGANANALVNMTSGNTPCTTCGSPKGN